MRFLHTMLRVKELNRALEFWCNGLGFIEHRRSENEAGKFTLVFLRAPEDSDTGPEIELTYNWDQAEEYNFGRNFGHIAVAVDDIYATCRRLEARGIVILRPPRDGRMAFVRSPDQHSVELLQQGMALPPEEPWLSRPNTGSW